MVMRVFFGLVLLSNLLLGLGCQSEPHTHSKQREKASLAQPPITCPTPEELRPQHVILLMLDRTDSAQGMNQERVARFREDTANLVPHLKPATLVFGRFISDNSYRDAEGFLIDAIPPEPSPFDCTVKNPFDPREQRKCRQAKHRYEEQFQCADNARERIRTTLSGLTLDGTQRTDVWGALTIAGEIFTVYQQVHSRWLIVYSDLEDNVNFPVPRQLPGFKGTKVIVRAARNTTYGNTMHHNALAAKQLSLWGANIATVPLEIPWQSIFNNSDIFVKSVASLPRLEAEEQQAQHTPPQSKQPSTLAGFMASLEPGPYGVIIGSYLTEEWARKVAKAIRIDYPELQPDYGPSTDRQYWAVSLGKYYSHTSAKALRDKAVTLGISGDAFVWDTRR